MPNFSGTWKMKSSENFEELLKALGEAAAAPTPPRYFWAAAAESKLPPPGVKK